MKSKGKKNTQWIWWVFLNPMKTSFELPSFAIFFC